MPAIYGSRNTIVCTSVVIAPKKNGAVFTAPFFLEWVAFNFFVKNCKLQFACSISFIYSVQDNNTSTDPNNTASRSPHRAFHPPGHQGIHRRVKDCYRHCHFH
jgi:hypothetical protein